MVVSNKGHHKRREQPKSCALCLKVGGQAQGCLVGVVGGVVGVYYPRVQELFVPFDDFSRFCIVPNLRFDNILRYSQSCNVTFLGNLSFSYLSRENFVVGGTVSLGPEWMEGIPSREPCTLATTLYC